MLDGGGWGRGKMRREIFFAPSPPLFFLLPIIYPLGKTLFFSPAFHCTKTSRWQLNFLRCERSLEKILPALQATWLIFHCFPQTVIQAQHVWFISFVNKLQAKEITYGLTIIIRQSSSCYCLDDENQQLALTHF